ncbi:lytic transglycosylase domain-containing protein [Beggiatoa leptomitoformis]|uniref:Transglycosylase SLT domain-containing protein n=1 Tax=Beggiatoa leptomitoformis TaxID=288004 RepID=A0A2N9YBW7_9GAMM|nr:lytic transglycosylase domain-containing protein [Beggiatoa leptomitoformis]AUI67985.1 transglycosylase SLT domain-containing protein [Beggiatoa leptomitoformis]QGX03475.1 transglycosylase SLT domain-containing protein [Beggiatoa leptomitoformis]
MAHFKTLATTFLILLLYFVATIDIPTTVLADQIAKKHGIDPKLFRAVITQESNWNPLAVSSKGAVGLTQLMPSAAQDCGLTDIERYYPYQNLDCGAWHLARNYQEFQSIKKALCAYNAGANRVRRLGACPPFRETEQYVNNIMAIWQR